MSTIYTKLHEALAAHSENPEERAKLGAMAQLPHFVLEDMMRQSLDPTVVQKSILAIGEAGRLRLPYPEMLIELWHGGGSHGRWRYFIGVAEQANGNFAVGVVEYVNGELWPYQLTGRLEWKSKLEGGTSIIGDDPEPIAPGEPGFFVEFIDDTPKRLGGVRKDIVTHVGIGLMIAILATNIQGVDRERIDAPAKLNKARAANGKRPIPTHTVLRIGHVYDSAGNRHSINSPSGRTMPIHMRAAHVRRQHHGPGWVAANPEEAALAGNTADMHVVLIDAVLVNYREGTDLAVPLPKLVKY